MVGVGTAVGSVDSSVAAGSSVAGAAGSSVAGAAGSSVAGASGVAPPPQADKTIDAMINRDKTYKSFFIVRFLLILDILIRHL
jgi:hypothetical protein